MEEFLFLHEETVPQLLGLMKLYTFKAIGHFRYRILF